MIFNRVELSRIALTEALRVKKDQGMDIRQPICIFDFAEKNGVTVRFTAAPSLEGLYIKDGRPQIILSSQRPQGRQRFNCAHEFAHHHFEHGTRIDEIGSTRLYKPIKEEYLADTFAGFLLMPSIMINRIFSWFNKTPSTANYSCYYIIARYLGVGYTALINHLRYSLKLIDDRKVIELNKKSTKDIKREFILDYTPNEVFYVDTFWEYRPLDMHVGDYIASSNPLLVENNNLETTRGEKSYYVYQALKPGLGRLSLKRDFKIFYRISRKEYEGLSAYRNMEEVDE